MKSTTNWALASALTVAFGVAHAYPANEPVQLAQAATNQSAAPATGNSSGSASGNTASAGAGMNPGSGSANAPDNSGSSQAGGSMGSQSSSQASSGKSQAGQTASSKGNAKAPIYLLVPVDVAANDNGMKNGCWARIHSRQNYTGDNLTIVGPNLIPDMDQAGLFGLNWDDRVSSVELGPKASMTVYDNENFLDMVTQFKAGQKIPDVSKRTGFFDEFASVKIDCT